MFEDEGGADLTASDDDLESVASSNQSVTTVRRVQILALAKLCGKDRQDALRAKIVAHEEKTVLHAEIAAEQRAVAQERLGAINEKIALV